MDMKVKLYNENCYDVLKTIESNSVDLILTDPPYNIGYCEFDKETLFFLHICNRCNQRI